MHQLILLTEEQDDAWRCPLKIGRLFINRLVIEEEAAFEFLATFELKKSSQRMSDNEHDDYMHDNMYYRHFNRRLKKEMGFMQNLLDLAICAWSLTKLE